MSGEAGEGESAGDLVDEVDLASASLIIRLFALSTGASALAYRVARTIYPQGILNEH